MLRAGRPAAQDQGWAAAARPQGVRPLNPPHPQPHVACITVSILAAA